MEFIKINDSVYISKDRIDGYQIAPVSRDSKWKVRVLVGSSFYESNAYDTEKEAFACASAWFDKARVEGKLEVNKETKQPREVTVKKGVKNGTK